MNYPYDYYYSSPIGEEALIGVGVVLLGFLAVILLLVLAVAAVLYIFRSIGLYEIARRRGLRGAWMAWVPVLRSWIVGCISDQYQYVVKGRETGRRGLLLILEIVCLVLEVISAVLTLWGVLFVPVICSAVCAILSVVYLVFYFMAMYDLYTSCSPQNNVLFLVLGIFFRVTEPFFLFFNRKKDGGMPPRREEPFQTPAQEPWETV